MKRSLMITAVALVMAIAWYIGAYVHTNSFAQDNESYHRLQPVEVLTILARPLPNETGGGYYLPNADISNVNLIGVNFVSAQLSYSDLSGSFFLNADFTSAGMQEVNLSNAELSSANLTSAWLFASNLEDATITYAILDGANLGDANLRNASFTSSSLVRVNLTGADITGTSFTSAIMEGVTLPNGITYTEGDDLVAKFGAKSNP